MQLPGIGDGIAENVWIDFKKQQSRMKSNFQGGAQLENSQDKFPKWYG
jgi:hypothetical protein